MKVIFSSLGSNYSSDFAWKALFARGSKSDSERLKHRLVERFGGSVTLTYKGRQALQLALMRSGLPLGSPVALNGFTCFVAYQAVQQAGYTPVLVDIAPGALHFDVLGLQTLAIPPKAVIIQNTLGYPCDIKSIERYCQENQALLIEDLAHSFTLTYPDGRLSGTVGDYAMLSFSQNKMPDAVAGGALVDHRAKTLVTDEDLPTPSGYWRNRFYPLLTLMVRRTYGSGIGRILHKVLKALQLSIHPMFSSKQELATISSPAAHLVLGLLDDLDTERRHRQAIAAIYQQELPSGVRFLSLNEGTVPLRFPILVQDRLALLKFLQTKKFYIKADTWFDAPIAPPAYIAQTTYKAGDCPRGEETAKHLINLPTHRYITPDIAHKISALVKKSVELQRKSNATR